MADIDGSPRRSPRSGTGSSTAPAVARTRPYFFHPDGERGPARARRQTAAKAVCARCPVIEACLKHALSVREPYGVWGGMSEEERARLVAAEPAAVAAGV